MDITEKKLLFLFIFVALGSICLGVRGGRGGRFSGRYRSGFYGYYSSRGVSYNSTGAIIGAVVGGIILIVGVCILIFILKKVCGRSQRRNNAIPMTNVSGHVNQMMTPPPYSAYDNKYKTGMEYNTKDNYNPPEGYSSAYPTPDVLPPPYQSNSSYPTDVPLPPYPQTNINDPPYPQTDINAPPFPQTDTNRPPYPQTDTNSLPYPINENIQTPSYPAQPLANLYEHKSTNENQAN